METDKNVPAEWMKWRKTENHHIDMSNVPSHKMETCFVGKAQYVKIKEREKLVK